MTGAVPVAIVLGNGIAVPGTYLLVGIALLLFSVGYAAMSSHVTNTGAFFAYVGRGLGVVPGIGTAFVSLVAYLTIQLAIYGFFGVVMASEVGGLSAYAWALLAWALSFVLSWFSVDVGAKLLGVLMILEVASLTVTALAVLFNGGGPNGLDVGGSFSLSNVYGEEARDPKRAVPRATYLAIGVITLLFAMVSLAMVSGLGSDDIVGNILKSTDGLANPAGALFAVATTFVGSWLATLMKWLVVSSLFAGILAFQNSAARYLFAMGRSGVLPGKLKKTNSHGSPGNGSIVVSAIAGLTILWFWLRDLDPYKTMFSWFSAVSVVAIMFVEVLVCLAVVAYFRKNKGGTVWNSMVAPVLALVALVYGEYLLMSRFGLLAGTSQADVDPTQVTWHLNTTGWILVLLPFLVFVIGSVIGASKRARLESADATATADMDMFY
ncbi:MAG: APC family permease [Actinobacteria bacterium]|nr:APC family permease [Actinomycetota bacterium]